MVNSAQAVPPIPGGIFFRSLVLKPSNLVARFGVLASAILLFTVSLTAGELFTEKELWATGQRWIETKVQWEHEKFSHKQRMAEIDKGGMHEPQKEYFRKRELARHKAESDALALKRDQVQNVLVDEANARVKSGKKSASAGLEDTAGTRFGQKGHRGMAGDRDMGGGERAAKKVKEVLREMGINHLAPAKETAGTLEIGGDFELTINKSGIQPKAGSEFHKIKIDVDARNPETYVSESMKVRAEDGSLVKKQVGTDYVEVQDHRKKAAKGLGSDGDGLVRSPEKMRSMAKGTKKTLEMGQLDQETITKILSQNGIKQTPSEFQAHLENLKEGPAKISDAGQAERMRRASEDIFNAAEQSALQRAKADLADLRQKVTELPDGHPSKKIIQDEIVDTGAKMKSTKAANEDLLSGRAAAGAPGGNKAAPVAGEGKATKALKVFGVLMMINDIGQSCQVIERYVDGEIPLSQATTEIVDQHVLAGVVGSVKHGKESYEDYEATKKSIREANYTNMSAFLTQWELRFRRAGLSPVEARGVVGSAILSGNLDLLQRKSAELRAAGKPIRDPELVVETYSQDDTPGQRAAYVLEGFATGVVEGGKYILTAPSRVVEAWAQGELNEAELEAYTAEQTADSRRSIFQKLVSAGFKPKTVLEALSMNEAGNSAPLRALFKKARADRIAREPTAEEVAAAQQEHTLLEAAKKDREIALEQYERYVNYLRWAPLRLTYGPNPAEIPAEGQSRVLTLTLDAGTDNRLPQVARNLEKILGKLTASAVKVELRYVFSCRGKQGDAPHVWLTASPKTSGIYPVTARLAVEITGVGLAGPFAALKRSFEREAFVSVELAVNTSTQEQGEVWAVLRKAPNLSVDRGLFSNEARVPIGRKIEFQSSLEARVMKVRVESRVTVHMAPDARSVEQVFIESEYYKLSDGKLESKERLTLKNFKLAELTPETDIQAAEALYILEPDAQNHYGSVQVGGLDGEGKIQWGKEQAVGVDTTSHYKAGIGFRMDRNIVDQKLAWSQTARDARKQQEKDLQAMAGRGHTYEGPIGKNEGMEGTITLKISPADKVVAGEFRAHRIINEDTKGMVDGEFLGTIDPGSGEILAKLSKSSIFTMKRKDGQWYIVGGAIGIQSFDEKVRVVGRLDGTDLKGAFRLDEKKGGFDWTATVKKESEK